MEIVDLCLTYQSVWAIAACVVMMCFDIMTGFIGAWKNNDIQSKVMREGLFHKGTLVLLLVLAWLCELFILHVPDLGVTVPLLIPACVIVFSMEVISITENAVKIYPDLINSKLLKLFKINIGGDNDA